MRRGIILTFTAIAAVVLVTRLLPSGSAAFAPLPQPAVIENLAPGGGGTWFQSPMAYYRSGKTVFGYIDGDGHVWAAEYDHSTEVTDTARLYPVAVFEMDDHDNPSFVRRASDGKIVAAWTTHVWNPYVNISTNADDATVWDGPTNLGSALGGTIVHNVSGYTYAHLHQLTDEVSDPIYMTLRYHDGSSIPHLAMSASTDGGATWGTADLICEVTYHRSVQNGNGRIDFILSDHPFYEATSIWHMYYEGGSWYQTDGTEITASQPFDVTDATLVYDGTTDRAWMWDVALDGSDPVVAYVVYEDPYPTGAWHYEYAKWNGSAWVTHEVSDAGASIYEPPTGGNDYAGGIAIDHQDANRVWYSKQADGTHNIFEAVTADDGATWFETQLTFDTDPDTSKNSRPTAVVGHNGELAVIWWRGRYTTYTDWDMETWGAST